MSINSGLSVGLTKAADILVKQTKQNLSSGEYPKDIKRGIEIKSAKVKKNTGSIDIVFTAPQSRAFEEGSGEHGPEGERYEIRPDEAGALAFEWDKTPRGPGKKFIGSLPDGRLMFRFVEHPGIEPRPYIRPALRKRKKEMKRAIGSEFKTIIRGRNKRVTVIE